LASKTPDFIAPKSPNRGWRQIAGPKLSPSQLHCGTVPDGPNGQWEGGQYRRIEARNWALSAAASSKEFPENGKPESSPKSITANDLNKDARR